MKIFLTIPLQISFGSIFYPKNFIGMAHIFGSFFVGATVTAVVGLYRLAFYKKSVFLFL